MSDEELEEESMATVDRRTPVEHILVAVWGAEAIMRRLESLRRAQRTSAGEVLRAARGPSRSSRP